MMRWVRMRLNDSVVDKSSIRMRNCFGAVVSLVLGGLFGVLQSWSDGDFFGTLSLVFAFLLLLMAFWSDWELGPRVGWSFGGLPIVMITVALSFCVFSVITWGTAYTVAEIACYRLF